MCKDIYWADKGYLTITEHVVKKTFGTKKSFIFTKLKDPAAVPVAEVPAAAEEGDRKSVV